jgi:outer membrane receptor protein involved in Fe transport
MASSLVFALALFAQPLSTAAAPPPPVAVTAPVTAAQAAGPVTAAAAPPDEEAPLLPALTVTATRTPELASALPAMITVLDRAEIDRRPADQTANLLVGAPGVHLQKSNHGGGSPYIHGMTGKRILLLVDGIRINNSIYRSGPTQYLNVIDPYSVERMEVVRGPASVLYGSDAFGGAVNIVTREPASDPLRPGLAAGASSADESLRGRLQLDGQAGGFGLLGGVAGHRFHDLRAGHEGGLQAATGYDESAADLKLAYAAPGLRLTGASYVWRQYDVPKTTDVTLGGMDESFYDPQLIWLTYAKLESKLDTTLVDDMQLGLSLQSFEEGERSRNTAVSPERRELNSDRTLGVFAHFTKQGFDNKLSLGGEWYADRIRSEAREADTTGTRAVRAAFPDDGQYETLGVYLQNEWRPLTALGILVGGRYSHFAADGRLANPGGTSTRLHFNADDFVTSIAGNFEFLPGLFVAMQAAQGFRAPNMEDFFGNVDFVSVIPNTSLRPEKSNDYEGGVKIRRWGFSGEVFLFQSYFRDLIQPVLVRADPEGDVAFALVEQRRNIMRARVQGFESGLAYRYQAWEAYGTYNFTIGDKMELREGAYKPLEPLASMPPREGTAGVRMYFWRGSFVGAESLWAFRQDRLAPSDRLNPLIGPDGTPGYLTATLRSGFDFGVKGMLRLGVENVFDKTYRTHGSGIFMPGRNVYLDYTIGM